MKAAILNEFGSFENFKIAETPTPKPRFQEVLVKVLATSVNPLDYQVRRGDYKNELALPVITGHDISGVIVETGPGVKNFTVGDAVYYSPEIFNGQMGEILGIRATYVTLILLTKSPQVKNFRKKS